MHNAFLPEMSVVSNAFPLQIRGSRFYLHSITILVTTDANKTFCLSDGYRGKKMGRKLLCRSIVKSTAMLPGEIYAYEGENLLVATFEVDGNHEISLDSFEDCPDSMKTFKATVAVELLREVDPSDVSIENLPSMLEMILSSYAINTNGYRKVGRGKYISPSWDDKGTHILTDGYAISVKPVEAGGFAAFIDPRVFTSYPKRSVAIAAAILVKGMRQLPTVSELTRVKLTEDDLYIINSYIREAMVTSIDGSDVTYVAQYCIYVDLATETVTTKDGPKLLKDTWRFKKSELSNWPVLVVKGRTSNQLVPMDMMEFCECQPIDTKNPAFNSAGTILEPQEREYRLRNHMEKMKLLEKADENQWLKDFGMEVRERLRPSFHRVAAPENTFSEQRAQMNEGTRRWTIRSFQFDRGGQCDVYVIAIVGRRDEMKIARQFGEWMHTECLKMGMNLPQDNKVIIVESERFDKRWIEEKFRQTRDTEGERKYLLYIDSLRIKSHGFLKKMERTYQVVAQHVTLEIAKSVVIRKQRVTLQNIMNKTNEKLGGRNYSVNPKTSENLTAEQWLEFIKSTLIIGADVCRPNASFATVGLSSNGVTEDPIYLTGDYRFQKPRQENIDEVILREYIEHILEEYKTVHDCYPEKLMYLRDGVNDSQHAMILREIEVMSSTAQKLGIHLPITAVVILKNHNCRILSSDFRNPLAGTVVDKGIVDPKQDQFYLQSHTPLKGTAKCPLFKILVNDEKLSKEYIEELMHTLAFEFEICFSPVSIPAPVFVAHEMAKRGNNLQREYETENLGIDQLTDLLALKGTLLEKVRVNA